jgi:hypothetical protein
VRLDPKSVQFVTPGVGFGLSGTPVRFIRGRNTVQLLDTALTVEGNVLKVGFPVLELFFRAALTEWSAVTIPYSRIESARFVRFPFGRVLALLGIAVSLVVGVVAAFAVGDDNLAGVIIFFSVVVFGACVIAAAWVQARMVIRFRSKDGRRRWLMFRITRRELRREFERKLAENRRVARRFAGGRRGGE